MDILEIIIFSETIRRNFTQHICNELYNAYGPKIWSVYMKRGGDFGQMLHGMTAEQREIFKLWCRGITNHSKVKQTIADGLYEIPIVDCCHSNKNKDQPAPPPKPTRIRQQYQPPQQKSAGGFGVRSKHLNSNRPGAATEVVNVSSQLRDAYLRRFAAQ